MDRSRTGDPLRRWDGWTDVFGTAAFLAILEALWWLL